MLILAGVSISAIVGEDGILTKARAASIASRKASILEDLNLELASYNIDAILKSPEQTTTMLGNLIDKGLIDTVLSSTEEYVADATSPMGIPQFDDANNYTGYIDYAVKKEDYSIIISIDDSGIYKAEYGNVTISSGGSVAGGTTLVTDKAFTNNEGASVEEQGKFVIDNDASVMFVDEINGELSIQVKSGTHAKVYAFKDMTLTNSGIKRSAIDIEPGGTLDLFVSEGATVTVNSGLGEDASGNTPGKGGYAGIHVPWTDSDNDNIRDDGEYAILNLYGGGTIKAIGGDAGNGDTESNSLQAGGGGAGAGIGGNGGSGGDGAGGESDDDYVRAKNGNNGENCGTLNIYNSITMYAYGGAGGSGGIGLYGDGGGAGGYPAAGIGGGGAGGAGATCCTGAGGYSGGAGGGTFDSIISYNGKSGEYSKRCTAYWGGGGYFSGQEGYDLNGIILKSTCFSGMGGTSWWRGHRAGNGGNAGKGGIIAVSTLAKIYAFNGNLYTDGTDYEEGKNQCPIYLQNGIITAKYDVLSYGNHISYKDWSYSNTGLSNDITLKVTQEQSIVSKLGYTNAIYIDDTTFSAERYVNINEALNIIGNPLTNVDMSKQGVGSGAGYIEVSNGTYTVDASMN